MQPLPVKSPVKLPVKLPVKSSESGLTLIECLAAIVIFALAIVSATPPIILAMATRVKAYRAQQAMQIAQSEIDRVRLITERGNLSKNDLENQLPPDTGGKINPAEVEPPSPGSQEDCVQKPAANVTGWCLVDLDKKLDDNNQLDQYAVQTFRTNTQYPPNKKPEQNPSVSPVAFMMGIRVYTRTALSSNSTVGTEPLSLAFSAANSASGAPLVVIYTPIVRTDLSYSSELYNKLLGGE